MDPKICKKTQDTLGKLIKKPPLTEKLLSKPPFRFLHDIVTSVIKTTGYMQGLFTDAEMNSENVKDKDSKVAFLQKAVDFVVAVTGRSLNVKPVKIVAGHEPERTNELLQALADAVNKNVDNDEYVKKVLGGGGGKSSGKEERKEKERDRERTKSADRRKAHDGEESKKKEKEGSHEKGDRERRHDRDRDRHKEKDRERESKTREKSRDGREEKHRDRSKRDLVHQAPHHKKTSYTSGTSSLARLRKHDPLVTLPNKRKVNIGVVSSRKREEGASEDATQQAEQGCCGDDSEHSLNLEDLGRQTVPQASCKIEGNACGDSDVGKQPCGVAASAPIPGLGLFVNPQGDGLDAANVLDESVPADRDHSREKENESPARINGEKEEKQDPPARLQRPSSAKGSRRRREGLRNGDLHDDGDDEGGNEEEEEVRRDNENKPEDEEFQKEMAPSKEPMIGDDDLPPQIAAARQLARPSSARPAPPRPKQEASESEPAMRLGGGQPTNLIVDDGNDDDEDDDNFLVEESAPPPQTEPEPISAKPTDEDDAEHGALVKKMLESKKELEGGSQNQTAQQKKTEIERPIMSDAQRRKQREIVQKEIDKLRASIQSLTRSANPLGKVMDYVQEDLDSMQQELDKWKNENAQHAMDLKKEMSVTDRAVEPLKQQLSNLERAISDQLDQIAATKSNIIKNDQKIEKMLRGITSS